MLVLGEVLGTAVGAAALAHASFAALTSSPSLSSDASHHMRPARPRSRPYAALIAIDCGSSYEMNLSEPLSVRVRYGTDESVFHDRV